YFSKAGVLVGAFNDVIRNAVRGGNNPGKGYVQGSTMDASTIAMCLEGLFSKETIKTQSIDPGQVLNYVACHDNYTLYDQLAQTMDEAHLGAAYTQAESIIFLMEGVPFLQEGEEFMRSKWDEDAGKYEGNSYNVGDYINVMDYSLKVKYQGIFEKFKELIAFRKEYDVFRIASREEISKRLTDVKQEAGNISFMADDLLVIHSILGTTIELDGTYELVYSSLRSMETDDDSNTVSGLFTILPNESVVLRKAE
ncbi:MAG: hypothetical protein II153_02630, partial [Erysipelotrichaceae bacterium]|nr:hypothetical protein [Erysipelotrichaceae bacterium]